MFQVFIARHQFKAEQIWWTLTKKPDLCTTWHTALPYNEEYTGWNHSILQILLLFLLIWKEHLSNIYYALPLCIFLLLYFACSTDRLITALLSWIIVNSYMEERNCVNNAIGIYDNHIIFLRLHNLALILVCHWKFMKNMSWKFGQKNARYLTKMCTLTLCPQGCTCAINVSCAQYSLVYHTETKRNI